jgi:hypothetical protein
MKKLLIVLLILGLAAPAMASEITFSGSTWVMLSYSSRDDDWQGGDGLGDLTPPSTAPIKSYRFLRAEKPSTFRPVPR